MTTQRTVKVRIPLTVEIDVDAWRAEYGCESVAEVREDVRSHVEAMILQQLDILEVLA